MGRRDHTVLRRSRPGRAARPDVRSPGCMRVLVTGATGLIGAHIVRALVSAGHEVRCLVRSTSRRDSLDGLPVMWFVADLLDADQGLDTACAECEMVFHAAARFAYGVASPTVLHRTAVAGTEALLRACAR